MNDVTMSHDEILAYINQMKEAAELIASQRRQLVAAHEFIRRVSTLDERGMRSKISIEAVNFIESLNPKRTYDT